MWEVATKAQQPFSEVDPFEIEDYLTGGYRLHQPLNCPDQLYSVLVSSLGFPTSRTCLSSTIISSFAGVTKTITTIRLRNDFITYLLCLRQCFPYRYTDLT